MIVAVMCQACCVGATRRRSHEPTEQQVIVHLFHKLPLGADRVEDLQQAGSDQTFRRDGGTPLSSVEPIKLGIQRAERVIHNSPDLTKGMSRRDAILEIDVAEQRSRHLVRSAHRHLRTYRGDDESCSAMGVEAGVFQQPVRKFYR